jgi:hypothetical protein
MQGRRETTHKAPRFFSRLPRTPTTLFPLPLTVQQKKKSIVDTYQLLLLEES